VTSNANAVAQYATQVALNSVEETAAFQAMTRAAYRERRDVIVEGLNDDRPADADAARGLLRHGRHPHDRPDENVAGALLLEKARVAVVPGTDFGAPGFVRMSYACSLAQVRTALERIAEVVA
jgi:aspartate aminotransferase